MDLPVFALHSVVFPGAPIGLRVFEPPYLALLDDVFPAGRFAVVTIRRGREVGGAYEANRVGVTVRIDTAERDDDGTARLRVSGEERVALIEPVRDDPYPTWRARPFPDEGGAGTDDIERACAALAAYLEATGEPEGSVPVVPNDPVAASFALAAATAGLVPQHQALLELPGAGERLAAVQAVFRREAALVRALGAGVGGVGLDVSPN